MSRGRWVLLGIVVVVVAFGAGFGWQYLRANALARQLDAARGELAIQRLEATLGVAGVEALSGNYEVARQLASRFYTGLQDNVNGAPAAQVPELLDILGRRDATITLLSRGDPRSAQELTSQLIRYRVAVGGPQQALPVGGPEEKPAPAQPPGTTSTVPPDTAARGPTPAAPGADTGSAAG